MRTTIQACAAALLLAAGAAPAAFAEPAARPPQSTPKAKKAAPHVPARQVGKASFYANRFAGRKMANGKPMNPNHDNAASRTLPLGTRALVTNLENGRSAVVTIEDRGPYVDGRIVDLSPATAREIGLERKQGVTTVEVAPLSIPQPDGGAVTVGEAAAAP